MKVHVVAWVFDGGGGFDWYYNEVDADKAFEEEKANADNFDDQNWTAFRFDCDVGTYESATDEIDYRLSELCDRADRVYPFY